MSRINLEHLAGDDLQKRKQLLDDREQAIIAREAYLDKAVAQAQSELDVIEAKTEVRGNELNDLDYKIDTTKARLATLDTIEQQKKEKHVKAHNTAKDKLAKIEQQISDAESVLVIEKERFDNINKEIEDRQKYQDTQEELIQQSLKDGNDSLLSIRNQVEQLELEKESKLREIVELKQDKNEAESQIIETSERLAALDQRYDEAAGKYKQSLIELKQQIAEAASELRGINNEADQKLTTLKAKETEILAQRNILATEKEDIVQMRRKANSAESLYGN